MNKNSRIGLLVVLVIAVGTALAAWQADRQSVKKPQGACCSSLADLADGAGVAASNVPAAPPATKPLPKLLDLGAGKCIPCKMMAPILEGLKREYAGRMEVEFIDVWQNPDAGKKYGIAVIPTQIFFDAAGKELFRHAGFYSKDDILAKWKELGVELGGSK
jgi:thioredoxin 1